MMLVADKDALTASAQACREIVELREAERPGAELLAAQREAERKEAVERAFQLSRLTYFQGVLDRLPAIFDDIAKVKVADYGYDKQWNNFFGQGDTAGWYRIADLKNGDQSDSGEKTPDNPFGLIGAALEFYKILVQMKGFRFKFAIWIDEDYVTEIGHVFVSFLNVPPERQ